MKKYLGKITIQALALLCVIFGIIGLFLPFLQGILFLVIGLYLFSLVSPKIRWHIHAWGRRYPSVDRMLTRLERFNSRIRRWFYLD